MIYFTGDPNWDHEKHERERSGRLSRLPRCVLCTQRIQQDDALRLDGEWYCDYCIARERASIEA